MKDGPLKTITSYLAAALVAGTISYASCQAGYEAGMQNAREVTVIVPFCPNRKDDSIEGLIDQDWPDMFYEKSDAPGAEYECPEHMPIFELRPVEVGR